MAARLQPVTISPAECQAHGFPPLEISFDMTGAGLMYWPFPGNDTLFQMSGPPGGPCHFSLRVVRAENGKLPTLEALVKANDLPKQNFSIAGSGTLNICGQKRAAIWYVLKPTPWTDHCASVLMPLADNQSALLFNFSASYDAKTGGAPHQSQQVILKSLKIEET